MAELTLTTLALALNFQLNSDSALPEWLLLVPAGTFTGRDGRTWHNDNPELVMSVLAEKGRDLVMDVEHASELKAPKGDPAPARGWFKEYQVRDGALWGRIDWNAVGKQMVLNHEYRYYSPALLHDKHNRVRDLASVGLTNKHNLREISALNHEETTMPLPAAIALALGLNQETATEQDAVNAISAIKTDLSTALNQQQKVDPSQYVPMATHQLALNRAQDAETKLAENAKAELKVKAEALVGKAIEEGRVAPANREHYLGLCADQSGYEKVANLLSTAPKVLAGDSGLDNKKPEGNNLALNHEQQFIANAFGNAAEELTKANQ